MTRDEMLEDIHELRKSNHAVGITGFYDQWQCDIDGKIGKGKTPMEAYQAAKVEAGL